MSQLGEFNKELAPSAIEPPANKSDITAGGETPGYYQFRLQNAEVFPAQKSVREHRYLYDIFENVVSSRLSLHDERYESDQLVGGVLG